MWAIIGGSGFEQFPEFKVREYLDRATPFGLASTGAARVDFSGTEILFIPRHGQHHEQSPSEVNYRANIYCLKKLGTSQILSFSSVGSLREELKPGDLVVPTQFIDRTKGIRQHTFTGHGLVSHVSLAEPTCFELISELKNLALEFDFDSHFDTTHVTIEGPAYSTQAESKFHQLIGADTVGMTSFPEYALAREAGIHYLPCLLVTDYDCWRENTEFVTAAHVADILDANRTKAFEIAKLLLGFNTLGCPELGIVSGLANSKKSMTHETLDMLDVLN